MWSHACRWALPCARRATVAAFAAAAAASSGGDARCAGVPPLDQRVAILEARVASLERIAPPAPAASAWADRYVDRVLFSKSDVAGIIARLGASISRDFAARGIGAGGGELVVVGLLDGVFMFFGDLVREIELEHSVDFVSASSYGLGTVSSGNVQITKDLKFPIRGERIRGEEHALVGLGDEALRPRSRAAPPSGKHVLIVDDICDSGHTLAALKQLLSQRGAASVRTCALLDKRARREVDVTPDFVGVHCPDEFVVGYGMDFGGRFRSLPFIGVLKPEVYEKK